MTGFHSLIIYIKEMEDIVYLIIVGFAILQIALLLKIWKMTNDVSKIKEYISLISERSLSVESRKNALVQKSISYMLDLYRLSKTTDPEKNQSKIDDIFEREKDLLDSWIDDYLLRDAISLDELKGLIVNHFIV